MKKYEVRYHDRHTEIVDHETVDKMIDELEMFDRTDVNQIHVMNDDGSLGDTIWTEEEGLFVHDFGLPCRDDDDYYDDEEDDEDDEDEEDDGEEYYKDGTELFNEDLSNITGTIESMIDELSPLDPEQEEVLEKMITHKDNPEVLKELKNLCEDRVCDSDVISNYISEYTIAELGDMDSIWNEFGDILYDTIYYYFLEMED